ncbi:MAG: hypothetical protein SNJ29_11170 [Rikenellaceae bacterium]
MSNIDNISPSFASTLAKSDLSTLMKDGVELSIDSLMDDGIAKDIPVVGTIVGLIKSSQNIGNWLFLKKILAFLTKLESVDRQQREKMINKIDNSKTYRKKVGDQLLFIIDSCEDDIKAEYIAVLFKAFINEEVTYDDFMKGSSIINRLTTVDFDRFVKFGADMYDTDFIGVGLAYTRMSKIRVSDTKYYADRKQEDLVDGYAVDGGEVEVELSNIGEVLMGIF